MASLVSTRPATDAASCSAVRTTLIPRALKAHAEVPVSKVEIELTDCWLSFDQIGRFAGDGWFSRS
jgi:hypothetical protein